ncbi:MAG: hypothetical protein IPP37_19470 [Saprospiraceae bacterium]|nr:hypothetical protein [Saprospiraceae bacterium]
MNLTKITTVLTLLLSMSATGFTQINLTHSIDSINKVGKELANYDFLPEKNTKKICNFFKQ